MRLLRLAILPCLILLWAEFLRAAEDDAFFEKRIRPVLVTSCLRCHGGEKVSGKLRVDTRAALLTGGENGAAIVAGEPKKSLLLSALRYEGDGPHMPPDKRLPAEVVADFARWIEQGAPWPAAAPPVRYQPHWAFQPVQAAAPPVAASGSNSPPLAERGPIDAFINRRIREAKLTPTEAADRRTLLRRACYDLTGLPPSPAETDAFLSDTSPDAFARLVDRLLASPQYGERWGRMWLDVVRYADTAGETADFPAAQAWRYRNYVLDAFRRDLPYDRFLGEQLAGDILAKELPPHAPAERYAELVTATGYLAIARRFGYDSYKDHYLTLEDTIDTLGKSVLGLTVGCARCHNHKYDPISMQDYYALYGIFESSKYAYPGSEKFQAPKDLVPLLAPAIMQQREQAREAAAKQLEAEIQAAAAAETGARRKAGEQFAKARRELARGGFDNGGAQDLAAGGVGDKLSSPLSVEAGQLLWIMIQRKANHGGDSTQIEWEIAESGGQGRVWNLTRDVVDNFLAGNPHADRQDHAAVWAFLDLRESPHYLLPSTANFEKHAELSIWGTYTTPWAAVNAGGQPIKASTVQFPPKSFLLHPAADGDVAVGWVSPISGRVTIRGRIADADPSGGDGVNWILEHITAPADAALAEVRAAQQKSAEAVARRSQLAPAAIVPVAYAVTEGESHDARFQKRGDPEQPGDPVSRRWLEMFGGAAVPPGAGSGRKQLAEWITSPQNPLTARVIVNRVWQNHFGAGLVRTPNDFGTRGQPPDDPKLLDYLAARLVESGWSLKSLHRQIMLSAAYQRACDATGELAKIDPENRFLARFERRRLSAEELRDSLLLAADDLDETPGGPHPFPPEASWKFTQHAPFTAVYETNRRSVYLMVQRLKRHPLLGLFDGADPNASWPVRQASTVPTQALFFMNDPLVHRSAARLGERLSAATSDADRLDQACRLLYSRAATADEQAKAAGFLADYEASLASLPAAERKPAALRALFRVMFASNEFVYVD